MIHNMAGGGGAVLNFKVVGGTTQPASPAENTIWVDTDTAITDWVFSSTQPAASAGRVWFDIGTTSAVAFNAVQKNGIGVYPTHCMQYVGDAWLSKTAMTYQGGAWVDWRTYIFEEGIGAMVELNSWKERSESILDVKTNHIYVKHASANVGFVSLAPNVAYNVTNYNKLCIEANEVNNVGGTYGQRFGLTAAPHTDGYGDQDWAAVKVYTTHAVRTVYELDISALSGMFYVWLLWGSGEIYIYNAWFE